MNRSRPTRIGGSDVGAGVSFSAKQGQYLAFIHYYTKLHRRAPAEADFQQYFQVSPPSVHQMILTLEARGLIERSPGQPRSLRLRLSRAGLPDLE
jgi:DNA-binding MarR family transcriptional regulator